MIPPGAAQWRRQYQWHQDQKQLNYTANYLRLAPLLPVTLFRGAKRVRVLEHVYLHRVQLWRPGSASEARLTSPAATGAKASATEPKPAALPHIIHGTPGVRCFKQSPTPGGHPQPQLATTAIYPSVKAVGPLSPALASKACSGNCQALGAEGVGGPPWGTPEYRDFPEIGSVCRPPSRIRSLRVKNGSRRFFRATAPPHDLPQPIRTLTME